MSGKPPPPPLPPRASSSNVDTPLSEELPPYSEIANNPYSHASLSAEDPRSSSTQSLAPDDVEGDARRRLLLIFIHGFMGAETSFQSFPAHIHNLTKVLLADSHTVHTKIYPRYRSRKTMDYAAEDFSKWLAPHESPTTDVVLLGHSMGGLVAAEIALLPPQSPLTGQAFRHRILGTVNFDVPFLGMHPGVISSGLASLFRPSESPEQRSKTGESASSSTPQSPSTATLASSDGTLSPVSSHSASTASQPPTRQNTLFSPNNSDPNFNPKFNNDVNLPIRKGWESAMHFFNKHSDNLVKAGRQLVKSHLEFGSAMADYPSLRQRYSRLRPLEEEQEALRRQGQGARLAKNVREVPRVRFVNYYTASTGRPKKLKSRSRSRQSDGAGSKAAATDGQSLNLPDPSTIASAASSRSPSLSPRISLEEHRDDGIVQKDPDVPQTPLSPVPDGDESEASLETDDHHSSGNGVELPKLPEIPPLPEEPDPIDLTQFTDRNARKIMERQHARAVKAYKQAERDRNRALKDRSKLEALYRKKANAKSEVGERPKHETEGEDGVVSTTSTSIHDTSKHGPAEAQNDQTTKGTEEEDILKRYRDAETAAMAAHRQKMPTSPPPVANEETQSLVAPSESGTALTATSTVDSDTRGRSTQAGKGEVKKKKDKKFCMLPAKGPDGSRDPTWVRVYMKDVDEVGAHCGLFVLSDTYEMLVGEVSGKIEEWARDDMSRRYIGAAH